MEFAVELELSITLVKLAGIAQFGTGLLGVEESDQSLSL
jgi:hypothetical protein